MGLAVGLVLNRGRPEAGRATVQMVTYSIIGCLFSAGQKARCTKAVRPSTPNRLIRTAIP